MFFSSTTFGQTTIDATAATEALRNTINKVLPGNLNIDGFESDGTDANCEVSGYVNLSGGARMKLDAIFNAAAADNNSVEVTGSFSNVTIKQLLQGIGANSSNLPSKFKTSVIDALTMKINPVAKLLTASMTTSLGEMEISGTKDEGYMIGIKPNKSLGNKIGLGAIDNAFNGFTLIYSSQINEEDSSLDLLSGVKTLNGLNLYWTGSLPGNLKDFLGLLGIPGINGQKTFVCTQNLTEQVSLPKLSFPLGGFTFSVLDFKDIDLELNPSNASISLNGDITLDFGGGFPKLNFTSNLSAQYSDVSLKGEIYSSGWKKAFGIDGIDITKLSIGTKSENGPPVAYIGGSANIFGQRGTIEVSASGMSGEVDKKMKFGFIEFSGNDAPGPSFEMNMSGSGLPKFKIDGKAQILGLAKAKANITITPSEVKFIQSANIGGLKASLSAEVDDLTSLGGQDLEVLLTIKNDLTRDIIRAAKKYIPKKIGFTTSIIETALKTFDLRKVTFTTKIGGLNNPNIKGSLAVKASIFGKNASFSTPPIDSKKIVEEIAEKIADEFEDEIAGALDDAIDGAKKAFKYVYNQINDLINGKQSTPYYYTAPSDGERQVERIPHGAAEYKVSLSISPTKISDQGSDPDDLEVYGKISIISKFTLKTVNIRGKSYTVPSPGKMSTNLGANEWLFHQSPYQCEQMELGDTYSQDKYFFTNYSAADGLVEGSTELLLDIDLNENDPGDKNDEEYRDTATIINLANLEKGESTRFKYFLDGNEKSPYPQSQLKVTITVERLFGNRLTQLPMYIKVFDGINERKSLLSTAPDGEVYLHDENEENGRQKWRLEALNDYSYNIKVSGESFIGEKFLSGNQDGEVYLHDEDDRSGEQRWRLSSASGGGYNIRLKDTKNYKKEFLSLGKDSYDYLLREDASLWDKDSFIWDKDVHLWDKDDKSGHQRWVICGAPGAVCLTCDDGIRNQGETAVDCGGPNCAACPGELGSEFEGGLIVNMDDNNPFLLCEIAPSFKGNWANAKTYCETYTGGGYAGWRLPGMHELEEIYTNVYKEGNQPFNIDDAYWSAESGYINGMKPGSPPYKKVRHFGTNNRDDIKAGTENINCTCVRISNGIPQEGLGGIFLEGYSIVVAPIDLGEFNWGDAKTACGEYNGGGFTNWRLPTGHELTDIKRELLNRGLGGDFNTEDNTYYWSWDSEPSRLSFGSKYDIYNNPDDFPIGIVRPVRSITTNEMCSDGIKNQDEVEVDCGGSCLPCATCDDGIKNQGETMTDCGGPCEPCPTCEDGILNQGERAIDCGGPCEPCPWTCEDGIQNQEETAIDCGGPNCEPCTYAIGDIHEGGIIYYIDETGTRGKVCMATDLTGGDYYSIPQAIYRVNTHPMDRYGGYTNWVLPSTDDLNQMLTTLHKEGIGDFTESKSYWSSTEAVLSDDSNLSMSSNWSMSFNGSGRLLKTNHNKAINVRAVRSFGLPSSCSNRRRNQEETDIDCGGPCLPCLTCSDGIQNQGETNVDCGGPNCDPCTLSIGMNHAGGLVFDLDEISQGGKVVYLIPDLNYPLYNDKASTRCNDYYGGEYPNFDNADWRLPSINELRQIFANLHKKGLGNFGESRNYWSSSAVDGKYWTKQFDSSGSESKNIYTETNWTLAVRAFLPATCTDGIQNNGETAVDCGGPCSPCLTCSDGIQNQDETGIDCGGLNCEPCQTCSDGIQNQGETRLDCGGPNCAPCPAATVFLKNKISQRFLFSSGNPAMEYEGGWLNSPAILGTDNNYYDHAEWYLINNDDGTYFLKNSMTARYLFSAGDIVSGSEGGWLNSPTILGADDNYYERAKWILTKNTDGTFFLKNKETNRLLFCGGSTVKENEGGWLNSPTILGADADYYSRARWEISGPGKELIE